MKNIKITANDLTDEQARKIKEFVISYSKHAKIITEPVKWPPLKFGDTFTYQGTEFMFICKYNNTNEAKCVHVRHLKNDFNCKPLFFSTWLSDDFDFDIHQ